MNKEYKPLGVAVFLVLAGLTFSFLFLPKNGVIDKKVGLDVSLFSAAHGAELVGAATLSVQGAPFLASPNDGPQQPAILQSQGDLYNEGALSDANESPVPTKTTSAKSLVVKVSGAGILYESVVGDSLQSLSQKFGVATAKLVKSNPSVDFSSLAVGTPVVILGSNVSVY